MSVYSLQWIKQGLALSPFELAFLLFYVYLIGINQRLFWSSIYFIRTVLGLSTSDFNVIWLLQSLFLENGFSGFSCSFSLSHNSSLSKTAKKTKNFFWNCFFLVSGVQRRKPQRYILATYITISVRNSMLKR